MAKILGISAFYHDSAAALTIDGEIIAAAQEERFTRKKHDAGFPVNAIAFCLQTANLSIDDLDAVVFYDKPLLKFERLLQTYYGFSPKGLLSFIKAIPVWLNEKLFLKKLIRDGLKNCSDYDVKKLRLLFTEHHLSHAASAFYPSPFQTAAILTIDGVGEWCTASIAAADGYEITMLRELYFPHSVGLFYSAFTSFLGFTVNSGEYKLMGLAPYGNAEDEQSMKFVELIEKELIQICDDGSVWLNQQYFNYATGLTMFNKTKWEKLFGISARKEEEEISGNHCNLALAVQLVTEKIVLKMAAEAQIITGADNICLAGGVALNCVANGKLLNSGLFKNYYFQPAAGDAGGAVGAALAAEYLYFEGKRTVSSGFDGMKGALLGPEIKEEEIRQLSVAHNAVYTERQNTEELMAEVAQFIADEKVVGWVQGRMEFGPRALGNRSILADPRNSEMQRIVNRSIKFREGFRPFAPSVLLEETKNYFGLEAPSPYMLLVAPVRENFRLPKPIDWAKRKLREKLDVRLSQFPAITHMDYSSRIQTVDAITNPRFHALISAFHALTGCPLLLNTSFNVRGEPPVCTAADAYRAFMATDMDVLVIHNCIFIKSEQPEPQNKSRWQRIFEKD
jgi:carbamoyltransferase